MGLKNILLGILVCCLLACHEQIEVEPTPEKPKNIILFIGDGMGPAYMKAYRMFRDDMNTQQVETTIFDSMLVGTLRTDPRGIAGGIIDSSSSANAIATGRKAVNGKVTDSAASATAYATGTKTLNGTLSITEDSQPIMTVLEKAKHQGKSTGMVVTSQIYHATPAAFLAHQFSRDDYAEIVDQYIDNQFKNMPYFDVLLGGGAKYFIRKDRNLAKEFESLGYEVVSNKTALYESNNPHLIGIFAKHGLKKMIDRDSETPSLADMTKIALAQLSKNENGFFLLVEGSQIDWAGHDNDIVGSMSEMLDFERALSEALDFAQKDHQTQIIVTADHSTGGLSVGSAVNGEDFYQWNNEVVKSFSITPEEIIRRASRSGDLVGEFGAATSIKLNHRETEILSSFSKRNKDKALLDIVKIINDRSYTGWTTRGHTGVDVNLYAFGPVSHELVGHWDNTKIADFIFELLE